jgi:hypothetical protein
MKYEVPKETAEQVLAQVRKAFREDRPYLAQRLVEYYYAGAYAQDCVDHALKFLGERGLLKEESTEPQV